MTNECTTPVIIAVLPAAEGVDGWLAVAEAITLRA
jgi:hypothetical protein